MEFRLLGPVELWTDDGQRHELGTAKVRCVLASLLLSPGRPVSTERLIDHVWDEEPPPSVRETLYGYISGLRKRLRAATGRQLIERRTGGGYVINVPRASIDLFRFEDLIDEGRQLFADRNDARALELVRQALALWRGQPLGDLPGDWARDMRTSLENRRDEVVPFRMDLELNLGRHASIVGELGELVARHPRNERLIRQRMLALRRCGRAAEALDVYHDVRRRLVDEHGQEPGHELNALYRQILQDDPALRQDTGPQPSDAYAAPNNLPREIDWFTGREEDIRRLMGLLEPEPSSAAPPVTVVAIHGLPGSGKSVLALHLAHRLTEHHPDAQLFLELYAHAPDRGPADTMETLDAGLRALGVPPHAIPGRLEDQITLWRTQLARRRCVLFLDDAATGAQVRPLLPGSPGSVVLITSRNRLTGLDASPYSLDLMSDAEAAQLFTRIAGRGRELAHDKLRTVVRLSGQLPMALTLAASRLANRDAWELEDLLAPLSSENRIAVFRAGEVTLAREFGLSYRELAGPQALAFRRLAMHPGADFTATSAAALTGMDTTEAELGIEELLDRNLLQEVTRGRYRYHDLLRDYARGLTRAEDDPEDLAMGQRRLLDHYIQATAMACRLSRPFDRHPEVEAARSVYGSPGDAPQQAQAWLHAEHDTLVSAIRLGYRQGSAERAALLTRVLWPYLEASAHWHEGAGLQRSAVEVLRAAGEVDALADTLRTLADAYWRLSEHDHALTHAKEALRLFRENGDKQGEALIMDRISTVHWGKTDYRTAVAYNHAAVEIFHRIGDQHGEARSLMHGAILLTEQGHYQRAQEDFERALRGFQNIQNPHGVKSTLINLGDLSRRRGNAAAALHHYEEAATTVRDLTRHDEALLLNNIGAVYVLTGRHADAFDNYHQALAIHREVGDRRSETDTLLNLGYAHLAAGEHVEALAYFREAQATASQLSDLRLRIRAFQGIGEMRMSCGQYLSALTAFQNSQQLARQTRSKPEEAAALRGIGGALLRLQGPEQARVPWRRALRILEELEATAEAEEVSDWLTGLDDAASGQE